MGMQRTQKDLTGGDGIPGAENCHQAELAYGHDPDTRHYPPHVSSP